MKLFIVFLSLASSLTWADPGVLLSKEGVVSDAFGLEARKVLNQKCYFQIWDRNGLRATVFTGTFGSLNLSITSDLNNLESGVAEGKSKSAGEGDLFAVKHKTKITWNLAEGKATFIDKTYLGLVSNVIECRF